MERVMQLDCNSLYHPLDNKELEAKAHKFNEDLFAASRDNTQVPKGQVAEGLVAKDFIADAMKLNAEDQYKVLSRAQEINDRATCESNMYLPPINLVFSQKGSDGKPPELMRFQMESGSKGQVFDYYIAKEK
jgi:hypothetical protein